jgi:hypothetical protein
MNNRSEVFSSCGKLRLGSLWLGIRSILASALVVDYRKEFTTLAAEFLQALFMVPEANEPLKQFGTVKTTFVPMLPADRHWTISKATLAMSVLAWLIALLSGQGEAVKAVSFIVQCNGRSEPDLIPLFEDNLVVFL